MEVLPAVGPVVGHLGRDDLDQPVAGGRLQLAHLGQLSLAAVDRVLDVARPALLLDPVRRQHRQLGEDELGLLGTAPHREADQPKALRTREKKLSSPPPRERRLPGPRVSPELPRQLLLLLGEVAGNDHVDDDHQVAGRAAVRSRQAVGRAARTGSRAGSRPAARSHARPRGVGT